MTKDTIDATTAEIPDELGTAATPRLFDLASGTHVLKLEDRFIFPPFTQLDGRSGAWQDRKRLWISVIQAGDIGADEVMPDMKLNSADGRIARAFGGSGARKDRFVEILKTKADRSMASIMEAAEESGVDEATAKTLAFTNGQSIFDPVLCEMAYRWFCPPGGKVLDPFAGGSVRGIVAAVTGRRYVGIDLSPEQVLTNQYHHEMLLDRGVYAEDVAPTWHVGDSYEALATGTDRDGGGIDTEDADFVWSCPPYHDLEKYSDDPRDLSNMPWDKFCEVYADVIGDAVSNLKPDRFCGFVVGEIRDPKTGFYRNFVGETIRAFEAAGAHYYNEALLVSPAGTLPMRAARQFVVSRKMGRTHQTVLLFCNGDPKVATEACQDLAAMAGALAAGGKSDADLDTIVDEDLTDMGHG
jgi:hypothetical protein